MEKPIVDMMSVTLQKIKEMIDVNTIIGQAITASDGTTIIPVSKLCFGFASGGSDFSGKTSDQNFGGGSGAGVNIMPVAFLVVTNGNVKLLPVSPPAGNTIDRVVELVPDMVDKITEAFGKGKKNGKHSEDKHSDEKHSDEDKEE